MADIRFADVIASAVVSAVSAVDSSLVSRTVDSMRHAARSTAYAYQTNAGRFPNNYLSRIYSGNITMPNDPLTFFLLLHKATEWKP